MPGAIQDQELVLEEKRLGNDGTSAARFEQASQGSDEVDEKNDQIAHQRIVAGRGIPRTCREGENVDNCERLMQEHQIRRMPIVDADDHVIGIVAQADLALKDNPERVSKTVAEISKTSESPAA